MVTLNKHVKTFPNEFQSFIELIVCDQNSEDCMLGVCSKCPTFTALKPKESISGITWWQWNFNENGRVEKQEFTGEIINCFQQLEKLYLYFLRHTYLKRKQSSAFKEEVESVQTDNEKVIIQVDFAENFTTQIQNAIHSSYWVSKQFTIFTACVWERDGSHSYVVVSDYLLHDKYAVMTFLALLMDHVENNVKHFENYVFFSDGAASQFKQRFTLCEITLLGKSLSWNFFATGHGKGVVDGIGGTLKRNVHTAALAKNIVIKNIDDFFDVASETSTKINVLKCSKKQVQALVTQIDSDTVGISAIPATQKMHSLKVISPFVVETKEHYYIDAKLVHTFKLLQESKTIDHEISVSSTKEFIQLKNIDSIRPGHWLLVEYEEEFFLEVSCTGAHVPCLEKPYGISEPQGLEKAHISAWYTLDKLFEPPVVPDVVQVKQGWKYDYLKL